jgi:hypothetical protein
VPAYLIIALSISIAAAGIIGAALLLVRGTNDDFAKAEGELANLALSLQERVDGVFQSIENVLRDVVGRIPQNCLQPHEFDGFAASQATKAILVGATHCLSQIVRIDLVNARGRIVGTSNPHPMADAIYLTDTSYYRALSTDASLLLYLSEPRRIPATGKKVLSLARKITDTDGNFIGIIVCTVDLAYFEKIFDEHLKTRLLAITLYRRDGTILAHRPKSERALGRRIWRPNTPLQRMIAKNSATLIRDVSWIDLKERLVALHPLANYPGGIAVSRPVAELMAGQRFEARLVRFFAYLMDIAVEAASLLGLRHVRTGILRAASESYLSRHDMLTRLPNR